jgi:hypothetical protein
VLVKPGLCTANEDQDHKLKYDFDPYIKRNNTMRIRYENLAARLLSYRIPVLRIHEILLRMWIRILLFSSVTVFLLITF